MQSLLRQVDRRVFSSPTPRAVLADLDPTLILLTRPLGPTPALVDALRRLTEQGIGALAAMNATERALAVSRLGAAIEMLFAVLAGRTAIGGAIAVPRRRL